MAKDKKETTTSRVDLSAATMKRIDKRRKKLEIIPKLKPFLEQLIELGLQSLEAKPQPEGER